MTSLVATSPTPSQWAYVAQNPPGWALSTVLCGNGHFPSSGGNLGPFPRPPSPVQSPDLKRSPWISLLPVPLLEETLGGQP
jgi:hypothetical protein